MPFALVSILKVTWGMVKMVAGLGSKVTTAEGRASLVSSLVPAAVGACLIGLLVVALVIWKPFRWREPHSGVMSVAQCGQAISENTALAVAAVKGKELSELQRSRQQSDAERDAARAELDQERETASRLAVLIAEYERKGNICAPADLVRAFNTGARK